MEHNYLKNIIDNYQQQVDLYKQMLALSLKQFDLLQGNVADIDLPTILANRKKLMSEINELNSLNKEIQEKFRGHHNMENFSLSEMEALGIGEPVSKFQEVLAILSQQLVQLNEIDLASESIIRQSIRDKQEKTNPTKAGDIYKGVMNNFKSNQPDN